MLLETSLLFCSWSWFRTFGLAAVMGLRFSANAARLAVVALWVMGQMPRLMRMKIPSPCARCESRILPSLGNPMIRVIPKTTALNLTRHASILWRLSLVLRFLLMLHSFTMRRWPFSSRLYPARMQYFVHLR